MQIIHSECFINIIVIFFCYEQVDVNLCRKVMALDFADSCYKI